MCFYISYEKDNAKEKIAKKDIPVWKAFNSGNFLYDSKGIELGNCKKNSIGFTSAYRGYEYKYGRLYKTAKKNVAPFHGQIRIGFHSYSARYKCYRGSCTYAIRCYIPAGAKYYYNPTNEEYVSSSIRITDVRKEIKTYLS